MEKEFLSIKEAAALYGFRSTSTLNTAARRGKLRTRDFGPKLRLTTRAWVEEYMAGVKPRAHPRGQAMLRKVEGAAGGGAGE